MPFAVQQCLSICINQKSVYIRRKIVSPNHHKDPQKETNQEKHKKQNNWIRKQFKKNKVWVAVDKDSNILLFNNKALIKYQLDQEHEYRVRPENLSEIENPAPASAKQTAAARKKPRQASGSAQNKLGKTPSNTLPKTPPAPAPSAPDNAIIVFTDGAASGNPGPSGIGVFLRCGAHEREISRYIGHATNNIAELAAIETALGEIRRTDLPVRLYTDSGYACGLLNNGWTARKNKSLVDRIRQLMTRFSDLKIIKVKGHSGLDGNEKADHLATSAIAAHGPS